MFDMVPPVREITPLTVLRACGEYSRIAGSAVGLGDLVDKYFSERPIAI
jgi:hypothetical protein